jgi:hypothetical protein
MGPFQAELGECVLDKFYLLVNLATVDEEFGLFLIDFVGVEDNVGLDEFSRLSDLFKAQGFDRTRIAVLLPNEHYNALVKIFNIAAGSRDLNFKVEIFRTSDAAKEWLGNQ